MSKHNKHKNEEEQPVAETVSANVEETAVEAEKEVNEAEEVSADAKKIKELEEEVEALKDTKLRLMAEFENFRRRTNKEKADLIQSAGEHIFKEMLPVVDDLERAVDAMEKTEDINAVREGVKLIQQKFLRFLEQQDVHAIETEGAKFDTDVHEALTTIEAGEDKKDMVIDCTQKGYKLGDRVIRFAKVVVGA